jgi:Zn-dependent carboxypeptidase
MSPIEAYNELLNISRRLTVFSSFGALLGWDQRTYMPKYAGKYRAMQFAVLREYTYEVLTSDKFGEMLEIAEKWEFGLRERMNIYWWKRAYERLRKIPKELAVEEARVSSESENVWVEAKKTGDFELIKPYIKRIIEIKREIADALGYERERYNALLDSYEPDLKAEEVERVFSHLKEETLKLLDKVLSSGKASKENLLRGNFPKDKQAEFCNYLLRSIGYDFGRGRLDETIHPFATLITPNDVRITTKYEEEFISPSIFGTLHEMGHGLYDMNLPEDMWGEPVGRAVSLSVHESQSRFWENIIGRSEAFWRRFYPNLRRHFEHFSNIDLEDFLFAINE